MCQKCWLVLLALRALRAKNFGLSLLPYISFLTKYCRVLRALRDLRARYFGVPYLPYLLYVQKISACPACLTCRKFWRALQHYVPYVLKILEFYLELRVSLF